MIRIRFHGRGGHGTKTASRVVGTAAFLGGYHAQDSPYYGAERRGAAVVAYTRIDEGPILERGAIDQPSLIIIADETLLEAVDAQVLLGQSAASGIFINTQHVEPLIERFGMTPPVASMDVSNLTLEMLGSASALSSGLAAAAAAMAGIITRVHLVEALHEEFTQLGLEREETERNVQVGERVFAEISPVEIHPPSTSMKMEMATVSYDNPLLSTPSVLHAGNAEARPTGTWRVERPVIDPDICTRCGLCFVRCPDGAIALDEDGFPVIDYDHCKGCMICQQICPLRAIESRKETRAW